MILYSYDHCPYCVKARMIFGLKQIPFELKTLLNDDEATPVGLIGQKMVPILQKPDGSSMAESMDIVHYVDSLPGFGPPLLAPKTGAPTSSQEELQAWLNEARAYHYPLAMPRWPQMGLEEFSTPSAQAYFTKKKEGMIGPFSEALENTSAFRAMANEHLPQLEKLLVGKPYFWGSDLSEDDFHVFATLRTLSTTQGIKWPQGLLHYANDMAQRTVVPLYWEKALGESF